ncbi:unnamed protein product [Musa acuminata subsp. malaccensis]|uniref:(wild Malaysian banana) hypothetical protein n=1 Tax=Musa acuminata subsp. malaccensis TaxID=214687 RepID=A0A804JRQ8_MUSAM|nr:unnamed protein product [Musa acuminata subsp. malaccensis]
MCLGRRFDPFDQLVSGQSRCEASFGAADVSPSLVAIIILITNILKILHAKLST